MFGSIGMPELIVIFVIALIIFGPRKLPELGKSLGKSISEFKRASNELRNTLEDEVRLDEQRQKTSPATPIPAASSTTPLTSVPTDGDTPSVPTDGESAAEPVARQSTTGSPDVQQS